MGFPIFDPTVAPEGEGFEWAPRPASLEGKVIGLLDNGKARSDRLIEAVGDLLVREHGVARLVARKKPSPYRPAPEELLEALAKEADLVVTGIGD